MINSQKNKKLYVQEWTCDHDIMLGSAIFSHNENTEYGLISKIIIRRELCEVSELQKVSS